MSTVDDNRYYPMMSGPDWSDVALWRKLRSLPKERKAILVSSELPHRMRDLQDTFQLDIETIGQVSVIVRNLFFGDIASDALPGQLKSVLDAKVKDTNAPEKVAEFIRSEILTIKPSPDEDEILEEENKPKQLIAGTETLPILQALSKYPRLGEQTITSERLRLKTHPDPVRPNLLNWLKVYRDDLGVGYHDPVLRGKFLFQSASCKGLTTDERERLNLILRSIEDNVPVRIDLGRMEIVFEQTAPAAGVPPKRVESESAAARPSLPVPPPAPKRPVPIETVPKPPSTSGEPADADAPSGFRMAKGTGFQSLEKAETPGGSKQDGSLSFSSRHAFPVEQGTLRIKRENGSGPATGAAPAPLRQPNPFRIKPMGLVEREKPEDANGRIVDLRNDE